MKALFAIVKLTLRNAIRSHVFQLLLLFLILCVALVPTTVGGSTAIDFIRVSLLYSLSGVGTILSLSALWVGCHVMSADIDSYQLHMVVSKPVSRVTIWLGKFLGVLILHLVLMVLAAAAIYGVVVWRFRNEDFDAEERARIRNEVLVGRRVYLPERRDYPTLANRMKDEKIRRQIADGKRRDPNVSPSEQDRIFKDCFKKLIVEDSETAPGKNREWVFHGVPRNASRMLYLRYRPYVTKVRSEDQRDTQLWWYVYAPQQRQSTARNEADAAEENIGEIQRFPHFVTAAPVTLRAGGFHESRLPGNRDIVSPKGEVRLGVINLDPKGDKQYYQPIDGPKLLVEVTGFAGNYARATLVMALQLVLMTTLSCAFGGFLTLPTAVFVSICYLVFGFVSSFMTDKDYYINNAMDRVGQWIARAILNVVVPLVNFDVTDLIADGELVEWSLIWHLASSCLLIRALPLALFGIYFYWRREIGLEIKK